MNIVCFAAERLDPVWRRRKHLMTRFQKAGHKVLFVEAPLSVSGFFKNPSGFWADYRDRRKTVDGLRGLRPLWPWPMTRFTASLRQNLLSAVRQVNHETRRLGMEPWTAWVSQPFWTLAADRFHGRLVYDCTDDWSRMPGGDERYVEWDRNLILEAGAVFAVSKSLYETCRIHRTDALLIPNGVDFDHYQGLFPEPEPLRGRPRPWFGYIGTIWDQRMDLELVARVAGEITGTFILAGPLNPGTDTSILDKLPNILIPGSVPYAQLPAWVTNFDVCLIPHRINELTLSMDPIKIYEYLAAGKPVVSTPVAGIGVFGDLVYSALGADAFKSACIAALEDKRTGERKEAALSHSWDARFKDVIKGLESAGL